MCRLVPLMVVLSCLLTMLTRVSGSLHVKRCCAHSKSTVTNARSQSRKHESAFLRKLSGCLLFECHAKMRNDWHWCRDVCNGTGSRFWYALSPEMGIQHRDVLLQIFPCLHRGRAYGDL